MLPLGEIIAQRLHGVILEGKPGLDYTFDKKRDKNEAFINKYYINAAKMKEILLAINASHYIKSGPSDNKEHPNDVVHIFKIEADLFPRFEEVSNAICVCIYVKVTWPDSENFMFIISFHEDEE